MPSIRYLTRSYYLAAIMVACAICLIGCEWQDGPPPASTEIESVGLLALQGQQPDAQRKLERWAQADSAVAQRELGLLYAAHPEKQKLAATWLTRAAEAGDMHAQFHLAMALHEGELGLAQNYPMAWRWFEASATQGIGKASFMLARMAKYGRGIPLDLELSVHWLQEASRQRDAQAMYLLSNAFASGEGVARNVMLSRYWLTMSAENDYNVAIQALAMELDGLGGNDSPFSERSRQLLKEAKDHRLMRWNTRL